MMIIHDAYIWNVSSVCINQVGCISSFFSSSSSISFLLHTRVILSISHGGSWDSAFFPLEEEKEEEEEEKEEEEEFDRSSIPPISRRQNSSKICQKSFDV